MLRTQPLLMAGRYQTVAFDLLPRLVRLSLVQNKPEAALGWAKVFYMMAPFDDKSLEAANKMLAQSWGIDRFAELRVFTRSQEAPVAPEAERATKNPLFAVALPPLLQEMRGDLRASAQKLAAERNRRPDAVSLYILGGDWNAAMQTALAMWRADPTGTQGIQEINRVFKVADLTTFSGNAFIAFLEGDGKGDNPVKTFLAQHPPQTAAAE